MGAKMTAWTPPTQKWDWGTILDDPNPQMRKKYDLPTNEKNLKNVNKGAKMTAWVSQTHKWDSGIILDPNPQKGGWRNASWKK